MKNLFTATQEAQYKFLFRVHPGVERPENIEAPEPDGDNVPEELEYAAGAKAKAEALRSSHVDQAMLKTSGIANAAGVEEAEFQKAAKEKLNTIREQEQTLDEPEEKQRIAELKHNAEKLYGSMNPEVGARKLEANNRDMDGIDDETREVGAYA